MSVLRSDIETLIHIGDQAAHYEAARVSGTTSYSAELPKSIVENARLLDEKLAAITVCDPAIGSGAFPVGMMQEIVRARTALTPYFNDAGDRTAYHFKRHAIQNCLYGVDIDPGAIEIAKLRLWLSLVVDEEDVQQIKPLPNLDYKVVVGNSLLGIEKTLFNEKLFEQLEELKPKYFDETNSEKKHKYKAEIDNLILQLTNGQTAFDFKIYFSEVFHHGGFDVVIGNPPYLESRNPAFKDDFKNEIQKALSRRWPEVDTTDLIPRGADLLVYFLEIGIRLITNMGIVAFITQNAWLDTEYGQKFQQFLLDRTHVALVVDSDFKHFDSVGGPNINTVISFFLGRNPTAEDYTTFARFQREFSPGSVSSAGRKIEGLIHKVIYRQYPRSSSTLRNTKWGILLSLDDIVLELLSALEMRAKPLNSVGTYGLSVGQGLNLPKDYYLRYSRACEMPCDSEALIPILTSDDGAPFVIQNTVNHLVNMATVSKQEATALANMGIRLFDPKSSSKQPPVLIMPRGVGRHFCALNPIKAYSASGVDIYSRTQMTDDVVYSLWAILNSSVMWLLREATGRKNLGGGMLKAEAVDLKNLPLFMPLDGIDKIQALASRICGRNAHNTLDEIETDEHREIDDLIFGHLRLSKEKQALVMEGLKRKILERQCKSRT